MKKILEVLQYGEMDIRFNTDIESVKNPESIPNTISRLTFAMMTKLWGGNEQDVLAMVRALAIADLALSTNRKEIIKYLDESSKMVVRTLVEAKKQFESQGGKVITFGPGIMPGKNKS